MLLHLLPAALLPCMDGILSNAAHPSKAASSPLEADMARGRAWALLGVARLHLVQPPRGVDPAGKAALKQAHLRQRIQDELQPELQVRLLVKLGYAA